MRLGASSVFPDHTNLNTRFIDPSAAKRLPLNCFTFDIQPFFRSLILKIVPFKNAYPLNSQQERPFSVFMDELESITPTLTFLPISNEPRIKKVIDELQKILLENVLLSITQI